MRAEQGTDLQVQQYVIRNHFIAMSLQQNDSSRFSPRPVTYLVSGAQQPMKCQPWLPSYGVGLKFNQKVAGYCQNIRAIIARVYLAGQDDSRRSQGL